MAGSGQSWISRRITSSLFLFWIAVATSPHTVLVWLVEAAEHLQAFSRYVLHNVHVEQVQLDELFALLSAVNEGEIPATKAIKRLSRSPHWVWVAMDR